ncbi:MAG: response regulator [Magnetococcales bacterium]|nr:response regulator [Magnetococcales bacterium]
MGEQLKKTSILIVDDTLKNLDDLQNILQDIYTVSIARNGQVALQLSTNDPQPDLILLNILLPDMDGYKLCRQLKNSQPTEDIPVIFIIPNGDNHAELEGLKVGGNEFIYEPLNPNTVKMRIETQLTLRKLISDTENKNHQKKSVDRLQIALQNGKLGFWDVNLISGEQVLNNAGIDVFGHSSTQEFMCREDWIATLHPDDKERVLEAGASYRSGASNEYDLEYRIITPGGEVRWVNSKGTATEWDQHGNATRMLGTVADISQRKNLEASLINAKDVAEKASQAKDNFLANISHEIRTPLNAVIGLTHICLQTDMRNEQREYLDKVYLCANSLLSLIDNILDFSKIEAGKLSMESSHFSLDKLLNELVATSNIKCQDKGLKLLLEIDQNVPKQLEGDSHRLEQVLNNLVGNAIKFTEKGNVTIYTELLEESNSSTLLKFTIQDSGIGMNSQEVAELFHDFFQADPSTTRKYGGIGLGLTISKSLVELMGGEIKVESKPGEGSRFSFSARFNKAHGYIADILTSSDDSANLGTSQADAAIRAEPMQQYTDAEPDLLAPLFQQAVDLLLEYDSSVERVVKKIIPLVQNENRRTRLSAIQKALGEYDFEKSLIIFQEWAKAEDIDLEV